MSHTEPIDNANVTLRGKVGACEITVNFGAGLDDLKARLTRALEQLTEIGVEAFAPGDEKMRGETGSEDEGPFARLSRELDVSPGELKKIIGIKGDEIQLYRASQLQPSEAASIICLVYEKALGNAAMSYETFDSLLKSNHVKMKTPLANFCFNMIRDGNFQKKAYDDGRSIILTPSGEKKAQDAIRNLLVGKSDRDKKKRK